MNTSPSTLAVDTVMIPLDRISTDEKVQTRVKVRAAVVREYAAAMTEQLAEGGLRFPPVILFTDGRECWLGDGGHRVLAARQAGLIEIAAELRPGTQRDAVLFAIGANSAHGLPRSNADKRRAVEIVLADPEWSQWSDSEIGRRCQVDRNVVSRMRRGASCAKRRIADRKVQRGDKVYTMKVPAREVANKEPTPSESPASAVAVPTTDSLGLPLPTWSATAFAALPDFQEARDLFERLATVIDRIGQRPAGDTYRQALIRTNDKGLVGFACPTLRAARNKLVAEEPYCGYCPSCHAVQPGRVQPRCKKCGGQGWTTRAAFESCAEWDRQQVLKMRSGAGGTA